MPLKVILTERMPHHQCPGLSSTVWTGHRNAHLHREGHSWPMGTSSHVHMRTL